MTAAHAMVRVTEDLVVRAQSFIGVSGEPCAWLDVGREGELALHGSAAALRRFGAEVVAAADAAERLADRAERLAPAGIAGG